MRSGGDHVRAFARKYREALIAAAVGLLGLWIATRGGWFLAAVGLGLCALAIGWGVSALRQIRFRRDIEAPGVVEIVEGRIGYFGAGTVMGGQIALDDMAEIRLITLRSGLWWRLRTLDGQALLIPLGASGARGALRFVFRTSGHRYGAGDGRAGWRYRCPKPVAAPHAAQGACAVIGDGNHTPHQSRS